MALTEVSVRLMEAGWCHQSSRVVLPGAPGTRLRFPALVARFIHPEAGVVLYDTGYSPRVREACSRLPEVILPLVTPLETDDSTTARSQLQAEGIGPHDVEHLILTHFHVDHVGGLGDFPTSRLYYHRESLLRLHGASRWQTMRHGVVRSLLPPMERAATDVGGLKQVATHYDEFPVAWDLFNDGSIQLVELPGHADGQLGAFVRGKGGKHYFFVTDACWVEEAYRENRMPARIARLAQIDWEAYRSTLQRLHRFHRNHPDVILIPSHCHKTFLRLQKEVQ